VRKPSALCVTNGAATLIKTPLPSKAQPRIELADRLGEVEKARDELMSHESAMSMMMTRHWRRDRTDFDMLFAAAKVAQMLKGDRTNQNTDRHRLRHRFA
jgi:hypothetical protein